MTANELKYYALLHDTGQDTPELTEEEEIKEWNSYCAYYSNNTALFIQAGLTEGSRARLFSQLPVKQMEFITVAPSGTYLIFFAAETLFYLSVVDMYLVKIKKEMVLIDSRVIPASQWKPLLPC